MELLIAAVVAGIVFAVAIMVVIYRAVGAAFDWLIYTFGNERAAREVEERWRSKTERHESSDHHPWQQEPCRA
jgi:hypothetical protein